MKLAAILLFAALCSAESITFTATAPAVRQNCGSSAWCQPAIVSVPQFDPSLGSLVSASWSLVDYRSLGYGWNDMHLAPGYAFSAAFFDGLRSDDLGFDLVNQFDVTAVTTGARQTSMGVFYTGGLFTAEGAFDDLAKVTGDGMASIAFTGYGGVGAFAMAPGGELNYIGVVSMEDWMELAVTYEYEYGGVEQAVQRKGFAVVAVETPEPRWVAMALGLSIMLGYWIWRRA